VSHLLPCSTFSLFHSILNTTDGVNVHQSCQCRHRTAYHHTLSPLIEDMLFPHKVSQCRRICCRYGVLCIGVLHERYFLTPHKFTFLPQIRCQCFETYTPFPQISTWLWWSRLEDRPHLPNSVSLYVECLMVVYRSFVLRGRFSCSVMGYHPRNRGVNRRYLAWVNCTL
jgi:hypothetical protein